MNVKDFLNKYELHDSIIENIEYDVNKRMLFMELDFCFWMQKDFQDGDMETGKMILQFLDVNQYDGLQGVIDSFSILDVNILDDVMVFSIMDDFNEKFYEVKVDSSDVYINIVK